MSKWLSASALAIICLMTGCISPAQEKFSRVQNPVTVYVLHRGLHTGIIVRASDIPRNLWPQHRQFPKAEYLEASWGDSQGYRFPWTAGIVLRATFASKGSVVLIHEFSGSITNEYAGIAKEIIAVKLPPADFDRLCAYIQNTYALDSQGRLIPMPSVYPEEKFFRARGHYSAIKNCNNWTAGALHVAGCPVSPRWSLTPGIVMRETRRFGDVIWPEKQSPKAAQEMFETQPVR